MQPIQTDMNFIFRTFGIFMPDGGMKKVVQLHTTEWPDLTAPEEPRFTQNKHKKSTFHMFHIYSRVLMDLIHRSHKQSKEIGKYC